MRLKHWPVSLRGGSEHLNARSGNEATVDVGRRLHEIGSGGTRGWSALVEHPLSRNAHLQTGSLNLIASTLTARSQSRFGGRVSTRTPLIACGEVEISAAGLIPGTVISIRQSG